MKNLTIVLRTRLILIGVLGISFLLSRFLHWLYVPFVPFAVILLGMIALDFLVRFLLISRLEKSSLFLFAHFWADSILLTGIFILTGGSMSPFTALYLVPVIYASLLLPRFYSWALVLWSGLSYFVLSQLPFSMDFYEDSPLNMMDLHVWGMLLSYTIVAVLVSLFLGKLKQNLQAQAKEVEEMNALMLLEAHFAKMGVVAASSAHEINTPLSTLAMIQEEWSQFAKTDAEISLLKLFEVQLERCRRAVQSALTAFGVFSAKKLERVPLKNYLADIIKDWQAVNAKPLLQVHNTCTEQLILTDHYLADSLKNLLDNSAKVASEMTCLFSQTETQLKLIIKDNGPGFSSDQLTQLKLPLQLQLSHYTAHSDRHRGLGLLLTQFFVKRLNGEIMFRTFKDIGAEIEILVPLSALGNRHV